MRITRLPEVYISQGYSNFENTENADSEYNIYQTGLPKKLNKLRNLSNINITQRLNRNLGVVLFTIQNDINLFLVSIFRLFFC